MSVIQVRVSWYFAAIVPKAGVALSIYMGGMAELAGRVGGEWAGFIQCHRITLYENVHVCLLQSFRTPHRCISLTLPPAVAIDR